MHRLVQRSLNGCADIGPLICRNCWRQQEDGGGSYLRRAVSHTLSSLRLSSSIERSFPMIEDAKPHWGPGLLGLTANRVFAVMGNEILIAVPLYVYMGIMLERSKVAEQLLETMGQLFGPIGGGLGVSVCVVGGLLGASSGIVGATVMATPPRWDRGGVLRSGTRKANFHPSPTQRPLTSEKVAVVPGPHSGTKNGGSPAAARRQPTVRAGTFRPPMFAIRQGNAGIASDCRTRRNLEYICPKLRLVSCAPETSFHLYVLTERSPLAVAFFCWRVPEAPPGQTPGGVLVFAGMISAVRTSQIEPTAARRRASMGSARRERSYLVEREKVMPHYFFHLSFGQRVIPDEEGVDCRTDPSPAMRR
jgi:Tripartite ATP-independent periplasmic transporter, DctM component